MRQPPLGNAGICNAEDPPSALREKEKESFCIPYSKISEL